MANKTIYTCDVCGKVIPFDHNDLEIRFGKRCECRGNLILDNVYDLCEDCAQRYKALHDQFVEGKDSDNGKTD